VWYTVPIPYGATITVHGRYRLPFQATLKQLHDARKRMKMQAPFLVREHAVICSIVQMT
jgi:hypothetical protein